MVIFISIMKKFRIETQMTLLAVVMVAAVVVSGYFVYQSLSRIAGLVHSEARPDLLLTQIRDVTSDLSEVENQARLYILTRDQENLQAFQSLYNSVENKIQALDPRGAKDYYGAGALDSVRSLVLERLVVWEEVLQLHTSAEDPRERLSEISARLESASPDTVVAEPEKVPFLKKIFRRKNREVQPVEDYSGVKEAVRGDIADLQQQMTASSRKLKLVESELIARNLVATFRLNEMIVRFEKAEQESLLTKTTEVDRLAKLVNRRITAFSVLMVVLLILVLYLFFNFVRKTRASNRMLKKAAAEAEDLARAKELFIANVSHEMRTPVNAIYGLTEQMLERSIENRTLQEQLTILQKSTGHLMGLVNDTLDLARMQSGKLKIEEIDFVPADLFDEVLALVGPDARQKGLELVFRAEGELPPVLKGDPLRLKQIVINLLSNAVKFTNSGKVELVVEPVWEEDQIWLKAQVKDTGIGISASDLSQIFGEFVQAETSVTRRYGGAGLGLSIVKKLVELQQGTVSMESRPGEGTTVFFSIPYREGEPSGVTFNGETKLEIPGFIRDLRVLVVDDEPYNRYLLKMIFEKWGVGFAEAGNGLEAVEMARQRGFDLILMDIRMPEMNGVEASKVILQEQPDRKIVALTAASSEAEIIAGKESGILAFLAKPFTEKALLDVFCQLAGTPERPSTGEMPEASQVALPELNLEELRRMASGSDSFFREMLEIFIHSTSKGIQTIRESMVLENWEEVANAAHKMAAPVKHLQAQALYARIKELERLAGEQVNPGRIPGLIREIETELSAIHDYLKEKYLDKTS